MSEVIKIKRPKYKGKECDFKKLTIIHPNGTKDVFKGVTFIHKENTETAEKVVMNFDVSTIKFIIK